MPGDVYHVDALVWGSEVVFAVSSRHGEPPLSVTPGRRHLTPGCCRV